MVVKKFFQHSIWCANSSDWIESDEDCFNDEVIEHRTLFDLKREIFANMIVEHYICRSNDSYSWLVYIYKKEV